jgi:hypothetical protein
VTHGCLLEFQLDSIGHADKLCYSTKTRIQQLVPPTLGCEGTVTAESVESRDGFVQHYLHKALRTASLPT